MIKQKINRQIILLFIVLFVIFGVIGISVYTAKRFSGDYRSRAATSPSIAASWNDQITKQLPTYLNAKTTADKQSALADLRTSAQARKNAMLELLSTPSIFFEYSLPLSVRSTLPQELYNEGLIEQQVSLSGTFFAGHADNIKGKGTNPVYSFQRTSGTVPQSEMYKNNNYAVILTKSPSFVGSTTATVKGYIYPGILVIDSATASNFTIGSVTSSGVKPSATYSHGDVKILVILFNFSNKTVQPFTKESIEWEFFNTSNTKSLASYFREMSGSGGSSLNFTGNTTQWITLNATDQNCGANVAAWSAEARIAQNVGDYNLVTYVFPETSGCPGLGWIAGTNEIWITNNNLTTIKGAMAHEFGHQMGLAHATFISCGSSAILPNYRSSCVQDEYSDIFDAMGYVMAPLGHYNIVYKHFLGWITENQVAYPSQSGSYTITPSELNSGTRYIKINIPGKQDYYALSYRLPIGFDNFSSFPSTGSVFIHLVPSDKWQTMLIDAKPGDVQSGSNPPLNDPRNARLTNRGDTFIDPANGIRVQAISLNSSSATVEVQLVPPGTSFYANSVSSMTQSAANVATGNRMTQTVVSADGTKLYYRYYESNTWQAWQSRSVASLNILNFSRIRSYTMSIAPSGLPKEDFLSLDGKTIYSHTFQNNKWGDWVRTDVSILKIPNSNGISSFSQAYNPDPIPKPKQDFLNDSGTVLYSRLYINGNWQSTWTVTYMPDLRIQGVSIIKSMSQGYTPLGILKQDVLSYDGTMIYSRSYQGSWGSWTPIRIIDLKIPSS